MKQAPSRLPSRTTKRWFSKRKEACCAICWPGCPHEAIYILCSRSPRSEDTDSYHPRAVACGVQELKKLRKPFAVCFEASTGYGFMFERLREIARRVVVAHPGQLRLIFRSKRKTDRVDAEKLAKLLFLGEVPTVYVPNPQTRAWRGMIEHRRKLVSERTRAKNAMRALLRSQGIEAPRGLWSRRGLAWLESARLATGLDNLQRDILRERLISPTRMIKRVERSWVV